MEKDGIELDEVQVVNVTGRQHRDKQKKTKHGSCDCGSSLRLTTIMIFVCIGAVYIIGIAIGIGLMFDSLEYLDMQSSNTSVNRLAMMIDGDMGKLKQYTLMASNTINNGWVLRNYSLYKNGTITKEEMDQVLYEYESTQVNASMGGPAVFNCGSELNFYALLDLDFETFWSVFYPGDSSALCGNNTQAPPPIILPSTFKDMQSTAPDALEWTKLVVPDDGDSRPMFISFVKISVPYIIGEEYDPNYYGYLVYGRSLFPRLVNGGSYTDDVPTCITIQDGKEEADKWDEEDKKAFSECTPGPIASDMTYGGLASFAKRPNETISATKGRSCPSVALFNSTATLMVGYMKLCGLDPVKFKNPSCIEIRVDYPMCMVSEGTTPMVYLSVEVVAMMLLFCIVCVIFLDCVVLRRIENLSNVIRSQTRGHVQAMEDETTASMSVASEKYSEKKSGKSGKSSKDKSGSKSGTSETSSSSGEIPATGSGSAGSAYGEIDKLKRAMEQNAVGLRKRLEAVNDTIKIEQQRGVHHKQALQLLNLWCGRKDFFPGLRPNAMQLRYEPTRNLDDIINNPLAIEYLKTHCESERTLENLWFILDVAWLEELEGAEDTEKDSGKRAQIHDVVVFAAKTIVKRYIALNAPMQINVSAGTFKKLREVGERYSRRMFSEAVAEVKLMLNTDILPRFQKTSSYSAMSETLYIDSSGGGDESSDFSEETVSTAGSILTDSAEEGDGGVGVGHVFARTFKNLHTTFDVGHDDSSSSGRSRGTTNTAGSAIDTTSGDKGVLKSSSKGAEQNESESSETEPPELSDSDSSEKDDEDKDEDKDDKGNDKGKEEKEEAKKENSESSESSSNSLSSDSLSESSTSTSPSVSDVSEK